MSDTAFLPDGYEAPVTISRYMKLEEGDNTFRVLSSAVVGYEYWNTEGRPIRLKKYPETLPSDIRRERDGTSRIKHFWAFTVWNYSVGKVQMLEITQSTIQNGIRNLVSDVDWGNPKGYDIKIIRSGEGLETEYTINPKPHSAVKPEIISELANTPVDLQNLFVGLDVFDVRSSDGKPAPVF